MNRFVTRALINNGGGKTCNRCISTANMVGRSLGNGSEFGNFDWRGRMMSTASSPEEAKTLKENDGRKEAKSSSVTEAKKDEGNTTVSSYWGIARPKITREDGTEWPWNCFMVIALFILLLFLAGRLCGILVP